MRPLETSRSICIMTYTEVGTPHSPLPPRRMEAQDLFTGSSSQPSAPLTYPSLSIIDYCLPAYSRGITRVSIRRLATMPSPLPSSPKAITPPSQKEAVNMSLHFRAPAILIPNLLESPEVTIKVLDEGHKKDFRIPRALICAKSEYFEVAFLNEMKETQTRVLELAQDADVTHAMMRLFITWLHTGLVYADELDGIPAIASEYGYIAAPGTKRPATGQASASHIDQPSSTDKPIEAPEDEPAAKRSKGEGEDIPEIPDTETQGCESSNAAANSTATPQDPSVRDPRDPITWSYRSLFEIYVFADRYDTVALRNQVMNIIQYKLVELKHFPGRPESIQYAVENLRSECPLRRLLGGWFSTCIRAKSFTGRREAMIKFLTDCPPEFLAEYMTAMIVFRDCRACPPNHDCVSQGHEQDDGVELCRWQPCTFHEHNKDGEEARWECERLWEALDRMSDRCVTHHDNVERRVYD